MKPITTTEAEQRGLRPLTSSYSASEFHMLENVLADMRRGGIEHALVAVPGGIEVWRASSGWKEQRK